MEISNFISRALKSEQPWFPILLNKLLDELESKYPDLQIDYEKEAGERWIRLGSDNKLSCLIHTKVPLIFIFPDIKISVTLAKKVVLVELDNSISETLSVDKKVLEELNGGCISENLDCTSFCLNDLWVTTL